jgi:CheY-like chemotaxis protein
MHRIMLKMKLCNIVTAQNGEQALEDLYRRARSSRKLLPNLIITDINMPVMSGIEFLKIIRYLEYTKDIPVVMLSSSFLAKDIQVCTELGILEYLRKPLTARNVEIIVGRLAHFRFHRGESCAGHINPLNRLVSSGC